jgi:hypothetical protein
MPRTLENLDKLLLAITIIVIVVSTIFLVRDEGNISNNIYLAVIVSLVSVTTLNSYRSYSDIKNLRCWINAVEPTILSTMYAENITNEIEFYKMLEALSKNNKELLKDMLKGKFIISSDLFTDYWIPLLKSSSVKYYYSTALIINENYFQVNQLEKMIFHNSELSKVKKIVLLFFISSPLLKDPEKIDSIKQLRDKILSKGDPKNIIIKIARLEILSGESYLDFGLAGDIAYAILEQNNKNGKEKYFIDFNKNQLNAYHRIFDHQKELIKIHGEISI